MHTDINLTFAKQGNSLRSGGMDHEMKRVPAENVTAVKSLEPKLWYNSALG